MKKLYCVYNGELLGELDSLPHEGVYSTENKAVKACLTDNFFIIPVEINKPMPKTVYECDYVWYPKVQTKQEAIDLRNDVIAKHEIDSNLKKVQS